MLLTVFCLSFGVSSVFAFETQAQRFEKEMAKYDRTGEMQDCVSQSQIKNTTVLDDNHILYELNGNNFMLNTLDQKCHNLGFNKSFSITVRGGRVCKSDIIHVYENPGIGGACGLGQFEKLIQKTKENN